MESTAHKFNKQLSNQCCRGCDLSELPIVALLIISIINRTIGNYQFPMNCKAFSVDLFHVPFKTSSWKATSKTLEVRFLVVKMSKFFSSFKLKTSSLVERVS